MISSREALEIVLDSPLELGTEEVNINDVLGRILAEDISADRNFPPFDRVMMDGIAIRFSDFRSGIIEFPVMGMQTAGIPKIDLEGKGNCIEVMTGSILPGNVDTVIKFEDVDINEGVARLSLEEISEGQHIHAEGSDRREGETIIAQGTMIRPAEVAILSTVGKSSVVVRKRPAIAIVSTGDELVGVDEEPKEYQIRTSNSHTLKAALTGFGIIATTHHINDNKDGLRSELSSIVDSNDIVVLSGGVSRGKKDYVPEILDELGVEKLFHRVAQRPGKPFWFGKNENTTVFALPGNPVSTYMCYTKYTLSFIERSLGIDTKSEYAELCEDFQFRPDLTYFLQVKLEHLASGKLMAYPVPGQGSGDLANLVDSDAFMELPADQNEFLKGNVFPIYRF